MSGRRPVPTDHLHFGGDYNPDQWPPEVLDEDIRLMVEARVNTVTVGVFSWASIEPREGEYEFGWLDEAMDRLHAGGIGVVLATPTASPPPWFSVAHPDGLPMRADGTRLWHGSRDTYNPTSSAYREAARRITLAMAERYGSHPALRMWHLHNEYGTVSFGPSADVEFRVWLRSRYGSLEELNRAWYTTFWSQRYSDWGQVSAPQVTQYLPNPGQVLDFKRFSADMLRDCLRDQVEVVRAITPTVPVTTNFMLPSWLHYDPWDFAKLIDVVSIDHYPSALDIEGEVHTAFGADLARSFNAGQSWMLMEQATTMTYDPAARRIFAKAPGRMERNTLQYLARGSTGSLFFQWRSGRGGAEFLHSPMVPHAGPDSRTFREIAALGARLEDMAEIAEPPADGGRVNRSRIAIVWDADAWWSAETQAMPSDDLDFLSAVRAAHRALWFAGLETDFVRLDQTLDDYAIILVPSKIAVTAVDAAALKSYVARGGHVVVQFFSGTTDESMLVRPGGFSGAFADMLGIRITELHPLAAGASIVLDDCAAADAWAEDVELRGAEVLRTFMHEPLAGLPAVTRNALGAGTATYVATRLERSALSGLLVEVAALAGVTAEIPEAGGGLEAVRRYAGDLAYLFVINHTDSSRRVRLTGFDLISGRELDGPLTLAAGDAVVLCEERARRRAANLVASFH